MVIQSVCRNVPCEPLKKHPSAKVTTPDCSTADQLEKALRSAGFPEVNAVHHPKKPWITLIAKK